VWRSTSIEIHENSIWVRARSHMTSHYTWGSVTILHDFGGELGRPLDTLFSALTISRSRLLARVWSGPDVAFRSIFSLQTLPVRCSLQGSQALYVLNRFCNQIWACSGWSFDICSRQYWSIRICRFMCHSVCDRAQQTCSAIRFIVESIECIPYHLRTELQDYIPWCSVTCKVV
jgi:hypothetical protein